MIGYEVPEIVGRKKRRSPTGVPSAIARTDLRGRFRHRKW